MALSNARNILVYRLGSPGDTMVALPALRLVERAFPQAQRRLLTNTPGRARMPGSAGEIVQREVHVTRANMFGMRR